MSNFNGRRAAPNVSQYIANLNQPQHVEPLDDGAGLDTLDFANLEFFDIDAAAAFNAPAPYFDSHDQHQTGAKSGQQQQQYGFNDFQTFPGTGHTSPTSAMPSPPALQGTYPSQQHLPSPVTGDKRKASVAVLPSAADLEESSRLAAEEDKRRRNTAASARFRIKKKQREQALEKQTKEMADKVQLLEGKVQQLEMENKWLKGLITEKSDVKNLEAQLARMQNAAKDGEERRTQSRTDGVGTAVEKIEA